jgi:hypothetical protein
MEQKTVKLLLIILLLVLGLNALSFRYRMLGVRAGEFLSDAYIIDNWTGRMWLCRGVNCIPISTSENSS